MGYKILGFAVWQGAKWYIRLRFQGARRPLVVAGLAGVVIAGVLAAQRRPNSD